MSVFRVGVEDEAQAAEYVARCQKQHEASMEKPAADLLEQGCRPGSLDGELGKLAMPQTDEDQAVQKRVKEAAEAARGGR